MNETEKTMKKFTVLNLFNEIISVYSNKSHEIHKYKNSEFLNAMAGDKYGHQWDLRVKIHYSNKVLITKKGLHITTAIYFYMFVL